MTATPNMGLPHGMTVGDVAVIKGMLARGDKQSDIAAWFGTNGGRVAEINRGKRCPDIRPAKIALLPPPGPYSVDRAQKEQVVEGFVVNAGLSDEESLAMLDQFIRTPPGTTRVFNITPGMSEVILRDRNSNNRRFKAKAVTRFARHMGGGTWALTGDTLKFTINGWLGDGQNRLRASVRSKAPFVTHIVFGLPSDIFDRLDQGQPRTADDVLTVAGYANSRLLSAAIRRAYILASDFPQSHDALEPTEVLALVRGEYDEMEEWIPLARAIYSTTNQPEAVAAAMLFLFAKRDKEKAKKFGEAWGNGAHAGKYGAIGLMEKRIAMLRTATMGRVPNAVRCALVILAWNLFFIGRRGIFKHMAWTPDEPFPEIAG